MNLLQLTTALLQAALLAATVPTIMSSRPYQWTLAKINNQDKKPLACPQCMTFWTTLIITLLIWKTGLTAALLTAGTASLMSTWTDRWINEY